MNHIVKQLSGILVTMVLVACNSSDLDPNAACHALFPPGTACTGTPVPAPGEDSKRVLATEMNLKWYDDGTSDSTEQTTYTASESAPFSESRTLAVPVLVGGCIVGQTVFDIPSKGKQRNEPGFVRGLFVELIVGCSRISDVEIKYFIKNKIFPTSIGRASLDYTFIYGYEPLTPATSYPLGFSITVRSGGAVASSSSRPQCVSTTLDLSALKPYC